MPKQFKEVRMILLSKKNASCIPDETRLISLLDCFMTVQERLFLNCFLQVLKDKGILPDTQSGFSRDSSSSNSSSPTYRTSFFLYV